MGYSTRRVSLNLQSLGVQIPRSRDSHRSPPNPSPTTAGTSEKPPTKRVKRSHTLDTSALSTTLPVGRPKARKSITSISETTAALPHFTPPPSPGSLQHGKRVDTQDIKDDIVVAVIRQLEATGNRPHQIKDIAQILAGILDVVATSQNPVAIISSRLTNYLKRPWTALAPCPLAKEQVTIHPRRVYYYLTSMPRQEIPEYSNKIQSPRHMITPSVSSGADSEQNSELFELDREEMSPESEFEYPTAEDMGGHGMSNLHFEDTDFDDSMPDIDETPPVMMQSNHPPLEHDEREFSQTAGAMRQRKESEQVESRRPSRLPSNDPEEQNGSGSDSYHDHQPFPQIHEEPEAMDEDAQENSYNAAAMLFGHQHHHTFSVSPMLRPQQGGAGLSLSTTPRKHAQTYTAPDATSIFAWSDLKSPENVELAELDDLLCGY